MNAGTTTPRGKDDPTGSTGVNLPVGIFGSVKAIYKSAWSRGRDLNAKRMIYVVIEAGVSLTAPLAFVFSVFDARNPSYRLDDSLCWTLVLGPPILFVLACHTLKKYAKDAPLLAFSVLLFSSGAVFTLNELFVARGIVPRPANGINSPWGDFLLAFSAFCVMVEEFSLLRVYDAMYRELGKVKNKATESHKDLTTLTEDARKKHGELTHLYENANTLTEDTRKKYEELTHLHENANTLYRNMSRQTRGSSESRLAMLLAACGVVGIIVLAFTSMC